jgi:predicted MFS family arabinose efflux permease
MQSQAELSWIAAGWLATANYVGYFVGVLLAASVKTVALRAGCYRIGLVLAVVSTGCMAFTQDVLVWAALRFLGGLGTAAGMLLASALVLAWLKRNLHQPDLGLHFAGIGLGILISGAAVELLHPMLDWRSLWLILAAVGAALFLPAWRWLPSTEEIKPEAIEVGSWPATPRALWLLMSAAYFGAGFGYVVTATYLVALLGEPLGLFRTGTVAWMLVGVSAAVGSLVWDVIARRLSLLTALKLAYLAQLISVPLTSIGDGSLAALCGAILFGYSFVGVVNLTLVFASQTLGLSPTAAMSRLTLAYGTAQVFGPVVAAWLIASTGSPSAAWVASASVMAVGLFFLFIFGLCVQRSGVRAHPATTSPAVSHPPT